MNANWWGLIGEKLNKLVGRVAKSEVIGGIPGSGVDQNNVPYSLTEEFVSVYRMHPLIPGKRLLNSIKQNSYKRQTILHFSTPTLVLTPRQSPFKILLFKTLKKRLMTTLISRMLSTHSESTIPEQSLTTTIPTSCVTYKLQTASSVTWVPLTSFATESAECHGTANSADSFTFPHQSHSPNLQAETGNSHPRSVPSTITTSRR